MLSVKFPLMLKPPVHDRIEHRQEIASHLREGVLDVGRDLVELLPTDEAVPLQFPQRLGQHGVGDAGELLLELAEADRVVDVQLLY